MSNLVSAINGIKFDLGGDSDQADKLSCRYSVILLVILSVLVSSKQYVGEPIHCWVSMCTKWYNTLRVYYN